MHHRRTAAAVFLGAVALAASACGSSSSADDAGSGSSGSSAKATASAAAGSSAAAGGSTSTPTDKQYCDALNTLPDTSKFKTLGEALDGLTGWADQLKSLGTPSDMSAEVAAGAKTVPDGLMNAMKTALSGLDRSTPISEMKNHKDLEKKYDAAVAPLEKTMGDGTPFDTWATAHCG